MFVEYTYILLWLVAVLALWTAGLPIATRLFRGFPGCGAALALPCSFVVLTVTMYWVGHLWFGRFAPLLGVIAIFIVAALANRSIDDIQPKAYVGAVIVFIVAFFVIIAVRAVTPGIVPAGGEKFLDYSLLNAILRANVLPPEDPWFADRPVRYYYGGQLWAGILIRLTGTPPQIGYNLAVATAFGTLVTTAYGLASALADARGRSARLGGLFGAFLVGFAGNLATPVRVLFGLLSQPLALRFGHDIFGAIRAEYAVAIREASSIDPFSYWWARYVIEGTLTPFPLWAFLNGDLNAYMIATPFLLLVTALCFVYYRTPESRVGSRRLLVFVAIPLVGGLLGFTSTWSVPTTIGLTWLTLHFAEADPATLLPEEIATRLSESDSHSLRAEIRRALVAASVSAITALPALAIASPFFLFHMPISRGIGFFPPRSDFVPLVLVWGVFLVLFVIFGWPRVRKQLDWWPAATIALVFVLLVVFNGGLILLQFDLAAVLLVAPVLLMGWWLLRSDAAVGYETVLIVAGAGLILSAEFVYARVYPFDPNVPRWNTVFKVSMQVWILWSVGAAAALTDIFGRVRESFDDIASEPAVRAIIRSTLTVLVIVAILSGSALFGILSFNTHFDQTRDSQPDSLTLDGTNYTETYHPAESKAIDWLDNRSGRPTIVSKPGVDTFSWVNAPSSLTGIPTVLGWSHERGYRGETAYSNRRNDVAELFTTNDTETIHMLLDRYDIRYIYVGPNERTAYDGDQDFSSVRGLTVAFRNSEVTIYRVHNTTVEP